jgi:hypothetical protein
MARNKYAAEIDGLPNPSENKVKFLVWFSGVVHKSSEVKPHHMSSVKAFFEHLGFKEEEVEAKYNEGLKKFGYDV